MNLQATEIRSLNNMSSDHDIHRRRRLLIPVIKPQLLVGKTCFVEFDEHAKCELAVIYVQGEPSSLKDVQNSETNMVRRSLMSRESKLTVARDAEARSLNIGRDVDEARPSARLKEKGKCVEDDETTSVAIRTAEGNILGLTDDLWRMILELLPVTALGQVACVCRLWHSIATDPVTLASAFMVPWKLKAVVGRPMSGSFWRGQLGQLAISHALQRHDTMAGLAVKYGVQVHQISEIGVTLGW